MRVLVTGSRVPEPVALMLSRYRCLVEQLAPQLLAGLYLYGSIALGALQVRRSMPLIR